MPSYPRLVEEIRTATPSDVPAIAALYGSLSSESARMRFSCALPEGMAEQVAALRADSFAVVAVDAAGRVVGEARACCADDGDPELALTIADEHQGHGLGAVLLDALRAEALDHGFDRLTAMVRTDNTPMIRLLQKVGCVIVEPVRDAVVMFEVGTDELMPGWPARDGRARVLVESGSLFDDDATERLRAAGYDVRRCLVARSGVRSCPLVSLGRCRVAEEADLVACLMPRSEFEATAVAATHEAEHRLAATSMAEWRQAVADLVLAPAESTAEGRPTESV